MSVAFVTQLFPPETAAGARRTGALAAALSATAGVQVFTVRPSYPHPDAFDWRGDDFPFAVIRSAPFAPHDPSLYRRALGEARLAVRLALRAARARPPLVLASSPSMFLGPAAWIAARSLRVPFVWDLRDLTWEYAAEQAGRGPARAAARLTAAAMWAVCRRAELLLVATDGIARALLEHGVAADTIVVAPNRPPRSVLSVSASPVRAEVEPREARVLYAGVVGRNQGLDVLVDVAARRPAIEFAVAGDGPERLELEENARRRGVANVRFVGFLSQDELAAAYADADVLFAQVRDTPTLNRDSIPSKLFEYMAAQRPIVYAGRGAAAALLREAGTATVVAPSDADAIAAAVDRLLAERSEASLLAARARAYVERGPFREDVMAEVAARIATLAERGL